MSWPRWREDLNGLSWSAWPSWCACAVRGHPGEHPLAPQQHIFHNIPLHHSSKFQGDLLAQRAETTCHGIGECQEAKDASHTVGLIHMKEKGASFHRKVWRRGDLK